VIAVIGGGLAGLACALELKARGESVVVIERESVPGGRVRTDRVGGFCLDRGFQVMLDSYPTLHRLVNVLDLHPRYFDSGAIVCDRGHRWVVRNPLRRPGSLPSGASSSVFSWTDKRRLGMLTLSALVRSDRRLLEAGASRSDRSTLDCMRQAGLSPDCIERFLRPFFGGVFLDNDLETSGGLWFYYLKKFVTGRAFVPARGMGELPRVLASRLGEGDLRLGEWVFSIEAEGERARWVVTSSGRYEVSAVVIATDRPAAARLCRVQESAPRFRSVWTVWFSPASSLYGGPLLVLPAGRSRLVRHLVQITNVAPEYSPDARPLVVATILNPGAHAGAGLAEAARAEIRELFPRVELELVDIRHTPRAVLAQPPSFLAQPGLSSPWRNVFFAGDHTASGSIEAALASGLLAARHLRDRAVSGRACGER
jgi:hypothetical protein